MKPIPKLITAVALSLSAWPLGAQENSPDRPPNPPQREAEPRREGPPAGGQRPLAGLFGALDVNHDGAIDAAEITQAVERFRKLDRNADGRITPDEMRPPGDVQRPPEGGERRAQREEGPRPDAGRDQGPRRERAESREDGQRREGLRREGERPPGAEMRREDFRREGDRERGPRAEGPGDEQRRDGPPPARRDDGDARREGSQGPRPGDDRHAQERGHRHGPRGHADRFAQRDPRSDFGRGHQRAPWEDRLRRGEDRHDGPMAMGPRMDARRGPSPERDGFGPREFRNDLGARRPQGGPDQMRQTPFDGPRRGSQPQGPGEMRRPEGRRDSRDHSGPPHHGARESRPHDRDQRDVQ